MKSSLIHRIVILVAFFVSFIFFIVRVAMGSDILAAIYWSAYVMFSLSIILLLALQFVVKILFDYLSEKQSKVSPAAEKKNEEV